jgi:4-amino-4-deoxy-L-arabinose transferase-like glycosyltransferase
LNRRILDSSLLTYRTITLAILLLAFALRCTRLDYQELRGDEAFGYFFSLPALNEIVERTLDVREPHPVASYWLQHLWLAVAGHSEFALRFLGVWWSTLAVALLLPLAKQLALPTTTALTGAALMAISPYVIWHAQDARMYNMSLALTLASTLLAILWWKATSGSMRLWAALGYLLVTWLALQTHYFALYVVVAQNVALGGWATVEWAWRKLGQWWGVGALLLLLWLPWLWAARQILFDYRGNGDSPALVDALVRAHSAFGVGEMVANAVQPWWATLALAALGLGLIVLWQTQRASAWFLLIYWLTPLAATWLSAQSRPIFNERYLVAAVPPVYLLMAAAVSRYESADGRRWRFWMGRGVVVLVVAGMLLGLNRLYNDPRYSKTRGWRELAATLERLTAGDDPAHVRLAQNYPDPTLWYYYQGDVQHLVLPPAARDRIRTAEEVEQLVAEGVARVLLVEQPVAAWDTGGIAQDALRAGYTLVGTDRATRWPVFIWVRPVAELEPVNIMYEGGLQLVGAQVLPTEVPLGGVVEVHLRWQGGAETVGEQEAVSLQLLNSAGELVAQTDRPLGMASVTTTTALSYAILLPMHLVAGEYQIALVVYDPSRNDAARRLTVAGADTHLLASILVTE